MEDCLTKLPRWSSKFQMYMDIVSKVAFALALWIEVTIVILEKSEYIIQREGWWFRITFLLFGLSLVATKRDLKQWIWFGIFTVIGVVSYKSTGRNEILRWIVFIWACYGKDMKKVLKFTFWYTLAGCTLIVLLSVCGIYGEVAQVGVYRAEINGFNAIMEKRFCFGMGHPNSFHCMMLVLTWLGVYCYYEKLKWYSYLVIGAFHAVVYLFTDSRTGLLMSMGSLIIFLLMYFIKGWQKKKWVYLLGIGIVIGCVILSVLMAIYSTNLPIFEKLDRVLTGRIFALMDSNRYEGMIHTWTLWSVPINNFYFDLGIVRFFYWFGIIPGIIYYGLQCKLLWHSFKHRDYMLMAVMVLISIYSVFEAHFISDYMGRNYILFFFGMYLQDMIGEGKRSSTI